MTYLALYVPRGHDPFPREVLRHPSIRHYFDGFGRDAGDRGKVALDAQGQRVGACWGRIFDPDDPGYGWVGPDTPELSLAVGADLRNCGLGRRLLMTVIDDYAATGVDQVGLSVDPGSPALRLYRRVGFVEAGRCGTSSSMVRRLR